MLSDPNTIVCAQCNEPYSLGHVQGEMREEDREAFLNGDGCPTCDWGEAERATGEYVNKHNQQLVHGNYDGDPAKYL